MGNWSDKYEGGTTPSAWSGSGDILKQYYKNRGKPVKFAQCWVYAGVTNSGTCITAVVFLCHKSFAFDNMQ